MIKQIFVSLVTACIMSFAVWIWKNIKKPYTAQSVKEITKFDLKMAHRGFFIGQMTAIIVLVINAIFSHNQWLSAFSIVAVFICYVLTQGAFELLITKCNNETQEEEKQDSNETIENMDNISVK